MFPNASFEMQKFLVTEGAKDLSVVYNNHVDGYDDNYDKLSNFINDNDKRFVRRFPIRREFIQAEKYSKKLGQVFDSYKYKIKKQLQEKQKEAKQ